VNANDKNIFSGSGSGQVLIAGDQNLLKIGNNPANQFCIRIIDENLVIGSC